MIHYRLFLQHLVLKHMVYSYSIYIHTISILESWVSFQKCLLSKETYRKEATKKATCWARWGDFLIRLPCALDTSVPDYHIKKGKDATYKTVISINFCLFSKIKCYLSRCDNNWNSALHSLFFYLSKLMNDMLVPFSSYFLSCPLSPILKL